MTMNAKTLIAFSMVTTMAGAALFAAPSHIRAENDGGVSVKIERCADGKELEGKEKIHKFDKARMPVEMDVIYGKISVSKKKNVRTVSITTKAGDTYVLSNFSKGADKVSMDDLAIMKSRKNVTLSGFLNEESGVFTVCKVGNYAGNKSSISTGFQK